MTRVNAGWSGGLSNEEVAFGFGKVCWEYRRAPGTAPLRFCFDLAATERAPKDLLLPMSLHIENKGLDAAEPGVLLACFQEVRHFSPGTRARFGRLAARAALTGALGVGMALVIRAAQPLLDRLLPAS